MTKGLRLFKTCESKATLQVVKVFSSCPSIDSASVYDVVDQVLVHLLQFHVACLVKSCILSFQLIEVAISERGALNLCREVSLALEGN